LTPTYGDRGVLSNEEGGRGRGRRDGDGGRTGNVISSPSRILPSLHGICSALLRAYRRCQKSSAKQLAALTPLGSESSGCTSFPSADSRTSSMSRCWPFGQKERPSKALLSLTTPGFLTKEVWRRTATPEQGLQVPLLSAKMNRLWSFDFDFNIDYKWLDTVRYPPAK